MKGINKFLELKWIMPITSAIESLTDAVIMSLVEGIISLNEKYAETYNDIDQCIAESEKNLASFSEQLTGDEFALAGLSKLIKK